LENHPVQNGFAIRLRPELAPLIAFAFRRAKAISR
jgi:hypothetical protein